MRKPLLLLATTILVPGCASLGQPQAAPADLQQQVLDAERSFARTMADRNHAAFTAFLSEEAVFFSGETPIRGREAVAAAWRRYFDGPDAPFSWEPDLVEVLASGSLALSTGPVRDPAGQVVGRFNSIWRREASGQWRIVFDKGSQVCATEGAQ